MLLLKKSECRCFRGQKGLEINRAACGCYVDKSKESLVKAAWTEEVRTVIQRGKKDALNGVGSGVRGAVQLKANMKRKGMGSPDRLDIRWVEKEMN